MALGTIGAIASILGTGASILGQRRQQEFAAEQQEASERQGRIMSAQQAAQRAAAQVAEQSGMRRRQESMAFDPLTAIRQADAELKSLPQGQLPEVRNAIQNALAIAERNQQLGRNV